MKKVLILSVILICFFITGCDNGGNENKVIDPPTEKNQELVCAGDFSEDLNGKADMYERIVLEFDSKGINYLNGTLYVDVEVSGEDIDLAYMEELKKLLEEKVCEKEGNTYTSCEVEIDERIAHIKATGDKKTITGLSADEDIDVIKSALENGKFTCMVR